MANPSIMDHTIEDEMEELTVQQAILCSLEDQTWDGIEEERSQALQKIERQKRLIKKLGREAQEHTDDKTGESYPFMIYICPVLCVA
jgi:hypothetical protein